MSDSYDIGSNNKPDPVLPANSNKSTKRLNNYRYSKIICLYNNSSFILIKNLNINCKDRIKILEYTASSIVTFSDRFFS